MNCCWVPRTKVARTNLLCPLPLARVPVLARMGVQTGLGIRRLTNEWQTFWVSLADQPESKFARVVGGFGWIANWGNNGVEPDESGMGPSEVEKFTFEVRNVSYVKEME